MMKRHFSKNGQCHPMKSGAIGIFHSFLKSHLILSLLGSMCILIILSSFTLIHIQEKEAEPTDQYRHDAEIFIHETYDPEAQYLVKFYRYIELFPYMRTYLYRFMPPDYKKICHTDYYLTPYHNNTQRELLPANLPELGTDLSDKNRKFPIVPEKTTIETCRGNHFVNRGS